MSEVKHTPLPWKSPLDDCDIIHETGPGIGAETVVVVNGCVPDSGGGETVTVSQEDKAFIVTAANAHYGLVAALREIVKASDEFYPPSGDYSQYGAGEQAGRRAAADIAEAALATLPPATERTEG